MGTNPGKISATKIVFSRAFPGRQIEVRGYDIKEKIDTKLPRGEEGARRCAIERVNYTRALDCIQEPAADFVVGIDGGVQEERVHSTQGVGCDTLSCFASVATLQPTTETWGFARSASFQLPSSSAQSARRTGQNSGALSAEDAASQQRLFQTLDVNGDGVLSRDEVIAGAGKMDMRVDEAAAFFTRLDRSGDGVISREEFSAMTKKQFFKFVRSTLPRRRRWDKDSGPRTQTEELRDVVIDLTGGLVTLATWYEDPLLLALIPFLDHEKG